MVNRVLVAHTSKYGSTYEIAEKIGQVLAQRGLQVDVLPIKKVKDLRPYTAVVLGSDAYIFPLAPGSSVIFLNKRRGATSRGANLGLFQRPFSKGLPGATTEGRALPEIFAAYYRSYQTERYHRLSRLH